MLRKNRSLMASWVLLVFLSVTGAGCGGGNSGPQIAPVHGVVKLDGQPLSKALVEFIPQTGRPSMATTDSSGAYDLVYTQAQKGAIVGSEYQVKISVGRPAVIAEGVQIEDAIKETVPAKYNEKTELKATVNKGDNVVDFDLKSK